LDSAIAHLFQGVEIRETNLSWPEVRRSRLNQVRFCWQLAGKTPPSDWVIATHTPTTIPALMAARRIGKKGRAGWLCMDYLKMFAGRPLERWLFIRAPRFFERILVISRAIQEEISEQSGIESFVVGLGLSDEHLLFADKEKQPMVSAPVLMTITDSRPRKGMADFLRAITILKAELPDFQTVIVSKEKLNLSPELTLEVVTHPSREELVRLYERATLFVFSSWGEGFGLPPLEAMAVGTPVVLTDSSGVGEYALHESNCLLVPTQRPELLAGAIKRMLTDSNLYHRCQLEGIRTARRFTWDRSLDLVEAALRLH